MDKMKVHRIVEYIRVKGEFDFDSECVESNLREVLRYYGVCEEEIGDDEYYQLVDELLEVAEDREFTEAALKVEEHDEENLLLGVPMSKRERAFLNLKKGGSV